MSMEVGRIDLGLDVSQKSFNQQLKGISGGAEKGVKSAFGGLGSKIGIAIGGAAVIAFTKSCLELGSNLTEVQNVVDTVFPSMNNQVNNFAQNAMNQFGLSETVAKKYMGTLGAMSKSMGFTEGASYDMAKAITGLSGDVASFYNMSSDDAYTKLKSIWTGETESLKEIGVVMTQTNLDNYALNNGFGKTTKSMTEQQKVMLRYQYVMSSLSAAQGDFAKTSGSWANQVRVLGLQFSSLKATIGQGLINLFTPIIKMINALLVKLQTLANAFKSLTELITGNKASSGSSANGLSGIASDADTAATGLGGVTDAAKQAAKATNALSIDELNVVTPSDTGGSGGGGGTGVDYGSSGLADQMATGVEDSSNRMVTALDRVKEKLNELGALFAKGFKLGLGDVNFKEIIGHVNGIKDSLRGIFTDPGVLLAANSWADTVALSLGKVTGSAASIGLTFAELYLGSIDNYLSQNSEFIKSRIVDMFNISSRAAEINANFIVALADIFTIFRSDNAKQIGADLIEIFVNSFLSITTLSLQFGTDLAAALTQPIIDNKDKIKEALEGTLEPIATVTGVISGFVTDTWKKVFDTYDTYVKPAFDNFTDGLSKIVGALLDAYNTYFEPVLSNLAGKFSELVANYIIPFRDSFLDMIGKLIEGISKIWNETLAPFVSWLIDTFSPYASQAFKTFGDVVFNLIEIFTTVMTTIFTLLGDLIDFLVNVFTGNWHEAWNSVKKIFKDIWDGIGNILDTVWSGIKDTVSGSLDNIKSKIETALTAIKDVWNTIWTSMKTSVTEIFDSIWTNIKGTINSILSGIESMANGVVKGLNKVISSMNGLSFDIPDWVPEPYGGKSFGFSIPTMSEVSIPKLAQGGYVKANTPQLAMIGDNKHQGEVVSPEDKLLEMATMAAEMANSKSNDSAYMPIVIEMLNRIIGILEALDLNLELDGKSVLKGLKETQKRLGYSF